MKYLAAALLLTGCADLSMPNAIQQKQFAFISESMEEHARERPPATPTEAKRIENVINVARQGLKIASIELKLHGKPARAVPEATDFIEVHHETMRFEEEVEEDLAWKGLVEPFLPQSGNALALGSGGVFTIGMALLKMFTDRRKMKQKDRALGQMFAFAEAHSDVETRERELGSTDVQAEYAKSTFKVEKKAAPKRPADGKV